MDLESFGGVGASTADPYLKKKKETFSTKINLLERICQ
jgi:hypothetical protein